MLKQLIRLPLKLIPSNAIVPVIGGPNKGFRWIAGSFNHSCWLGWYEKLCAEYITTHVRSGSIAFDVGANVGYYTLLLSRCVGNNGRVISFEPNSTNIGYLKE